MNLVRDTSWHWLDGSPVDAAVITWCPNSTHEIAIGAHCAAYDSKLHCVNNYPCSTRLSAPCVSGERTFICLRRDFYASFWPL